MAWTRADQAKQNLNVLSGNCQWNGRTWWGGRGEKKIAIVEILSANVILDFSRDPFSFVSCISFYFDDL